MDESDPRALERVGSVLDEKWTLERILGSGAMGAVYAARHRNGARAAVKVLHPELARRPEVRERFLREGYAANKVEHRGAVRVLDDDIVKGGPDDGTAYLVMEILEGESLEDRLGRPPPLTEVEVLSILDDVLAVLEAAHDHGVIHRDLKPANLFLNKDPAGPGVKVLDFGLARLEDLGAVTTAGLALGTPSFMAPEQAAGRSTEIDARTDLFALGATAFEILAKRPVHEANGIIALVSRMATVPAPKLRDVAPQVSASVAAIVDRALEFKREDRYPSASAMRVDVRRALDAAIEETTAATIVPPLASPGPMSVRGGGAEASGAASTDRVSSRAKIAASPAAKLDVEDDGGARSARMSVSDRDTQVRTAGPQPPEREERSDSAVGSRRRSRLPVVLALLVAGGVGVVGVRAASNRTMGAGLAGLGVGPSASVASTTETIGGADGSALGARASSSVDSGHPELVEPADGSTSPSFNSGGELAGGSSQDGAIDGSSASSSMLLDGDASVELEGDEGEEDEDEMDASSDESVDAGEAPRRPRVAPGVIKPRPRAAPGTKRPPHKRKPRRKPWMR